MPHYTINTFCTLFYSSAVLERWAMPQPFISGLVLHPHLLQPPKTGPFHWTRASSLAVPHRHCMHPLLSGSRMLPSWRWVSVAPFSLTTVLHLLLSSMLMAQVCHPLTTVIFLLSVDSVDFSYITPLPSWARTALCRIHPGYDRRCFIQ